MAYEALYRRYRPSRFEDAFYGQAHVVAALRNAVAHDRVGHAYLFSGPRGTGKTTSARILAKALNCTDLQAGEPCNACDSCASFASNSSYDLHELDAASNNGVEAMRDLIGKVALGSPGRTKVYILDEVHMLSSGAENALLKTLEEPPPHVVFVLCTTEPNKVVPTIRSRTQHLEFSLLSSADVNGLIDHVVADAGLEITDDDRAYVARAGGGSARDTLSALDQVVAAGGAPQVGQYLDALVQALADRDTPGALLAIDGAVQAGRDPAVIAGSLLTDLRGAFLASMQADVGHLPDVEQEKALARAGAMSAAQITRAIEVLGQSIIDMRQAPDPRVDLEVALVRLTRIDLDHTPAALLERIERLEQGAPSVAASSVAHGAAESPQTTRPQATHHDASSDTTQNLDGISEPVTTTSPPIAAVPDLAPEPAAAPQQPSAGRARPGDMVRAMLAEQQAGKSGKPLVPPRDASPTSDPTAAPAVPATDAPPPEVRSLADVRRERREQGDTTSPKSPAVTPTSDVPANEASPQAPRAVESAPVEHSKSARPIDPEPTDHEPPTAEPSSPEPAAPLPQPVRESAEPSAVKPAAPPATGGGDDPLPTLTELTALWDTGLITGLSGKVRSRFIAGHFVETTAKAVQFALPNPVHRDRCQEVRAEFDEALATHFGRAIAVDLVVDTTQAEPDIFDAAPADRNDNSDVEFEDEPAIDPNELVDATDVASSGLDRLLATFEGSQVLDEDQP